MIMSQIASWFFDESGFEVFEASTLTIGGVVLALFVGTIVLALTSFEYIKIGNATIGNEVEVNAALERFY